MTALSRELADFLIELSIALHKHDQAALDDKSARERGLRGAQLWVGLARAALSAEAMASEDGPPPATEPSVIAKAIDERQNNAAYDQVIVGYLLQIADELKHTGGAEAAALRRRTSKLVGALQPGTLRRLIEMGGDNAQRTKFAIDATHGLAVDAVLEIVRAMADASHKTVSDPLVRMLSKLAQHAEQGTPQMRPQADEALRDQVRDLLQGWTLEDPNPDAYGQALQKMAAAAPAASQRREGQQAAEPLRIVQTAVETGALGFGAWRAVERLVAEHHVDALVDLLAESPDASRPAVRADIAPLWTRVTSPDVVRQLASSEPPDFATLDRVLPRLHVDAFEPLLDVLGESESRTTRRGLLDRLTRAPRELGPVIATRLSGDIPWYVTRNLLLILDGLPALPAGFSQPWWGWRREGGTMSKPPLSWPSRPLPTIPMSAAPRVPRRAPRQRSSDERRSRPFSERVRPGARRDGALSRRAPGAGARAGCGLSTDPGSPERHRASAVHVPR